MDFDHRAQDSLARKLKKRGFTHGYIADVTGLKVSRMTTISKHLRKRGELPSLQDRQGRTDWAHRQIARYDELIAECKRLRRMAER